MSCSDVAQKIGQHLLFLGTSSAGWSIAQFQEAAQFAKAHDVSSLIIKAGDGANWWYGGINGYRAIRDVIHAEGVGCIPYVYSYGNTYGYLNGEIGVLQALLDEPDNVVIADMETEWNNQAAWASELCHAMQGRGTFLVSTWADPALQGWIEVIQALNPCVAAYLPQQYDNYLASCWQQFGQAGAACLQPTVSITGVGPGNPNDPVAIAKAAHSQGHTALSVWYYETAEANPALLDQIFAAFPKTEETIMIDLSNPVVANYFEVAPGGAWHCKSTGAVIGGAILKEYQSFGNKDLCGLTYWGLPLTSEIGGIPNAQGCVYQRFERVVAGYVPDPAHNPIDNPPGLSGNVFLLHIDKGIGEDPRVEDLQAQVQALQPASQQATITALEAKIDQAVKDLS